MNRIDQMKDIAARKDDYKQAHKDRVYIAYGTDNHFDLSPWPLLPTSHALVHHLMGHTVTSSLETERSPPSITRVRVERSSSTAESTTAKPTTSTAKSAWSACPKVCKQVGHVLWRHSAHSAHSTAIVESILVFAEVVAFSPCRVRENGVSFDDEFELFFVTALVGMMLERFSPVSLLDLQLATISWHAYKSPITPSATSSTPIVETNNKKRLTKNFVVILRLAPLQLGLCLLQLHLQTLDVVHHVVKFCLLYGRFEVCNGGVVLLEMQVNACTSSEGFV